MWKDYSSGYIKNNRASGISIMVAALISSLLLSLLCGLFYNLWIYEIERLKAEEGSWQGRIVGEIDTQTLEMIRNYANVEEAVINESLSEGQEIVVDIYLKNMRRILADMPLIAALAGLPAEAAAYHYSLLNMYLIRDANDPALRWIFPFFCMITVLACLSLVLVIHNAFAVTMNARIHQFGIFSSIGATPGQIRTCLVQEAFVLSAIPIAAGSLLGILIGMGIIEGMNVLLADVEGRLVLPFAYHPLILVISLLAAFLTIWVSAWIPARKLSRLTPLEAIRNTGELQLKRKRNSPVLSRLFGMEGELAGNALKAQRKAMRTAFLSLVLSFMAFALMMCFFTVMKVSQRETYFEKYQDVWDVMVTVKDAEIDVFAYAEELRGIPGVQSSVVYQRAAAKRIVVPEEISEEMRAIGGLENASAKYVSAMDGAWLVNAPLVILDDVGFGEYCERIGVLPREGGAVILNQTRDWTDPNFRKRRTLPYLTESAPTTLLRRAGQEEITAEIPVIAYTGEVPVLREEYGTLDFYEVVHFIPQSVWTEIKEQIGGEEQEVSIRILAAEGAALAELDAIEEAVEGILGENDGVEIENRIQDKLDNDHMINGMMAIVSIFCALVAVIGIGNVFSNTFGFVRQRKREFARYMSVGLTPGGMKKIFCVEALVIAGRPVLITLPVTAAVVVFFIKVSYLEPMTFLREAPILPILAFLLAIFGGVALAYYLGGKKMLRICLTETLRDDTMT